MEATIRLFKAIMVSHHVDGVALDTALLFKTLPKGFVVAPDVVAQYPDKNHLIDMIEKAYGLSPDKMNEAFHKSFAKVKNASIEQLVYEQLLHYLTTYGAENVGMFNSESVFVPREALEIPEIDVDGFRLVVIKGLTKVELKDKLLQLLGSGVALGEDTVADALEVAQLVDIDATDLPNIRNNEVKVALYDFLGLVPAAPVDFLRFVIFRATNQTLIIKNDALLEQIKGRNNLDIARYFGQYEKEYGLEKLAEVFYRFKPIFLAFRTTGPLKKQINRVRRLAETNHKPLAPDYLNELTAKLSNAAVISGPELQKALAGANTFRKIRLAYALKYRTTDAEAILYRIRNGKSFVKEFTFANRDRAQTALEHVLESIVQDLKTNVEGKKIFIPEYVRYALPATERQFTGDIPTGTSVRVPQDMVAGVHWENQKQHRIDLDLSMVSIEGKIGWDGDYRNAGRTVLFSGDLTDAPRPKGATEVFYVGEDAHGAYLMMLNYYNHDASVPVPFKLLVAQDEVKNFDKSYVVDPNKMVAITTSEIKEKQKILGIVVANRTDVRFYYAETNIGNSITARNSERSAMAREYLLNMYTDTISLNDLLVQAGAELVESAAEAEIDLTPEAVERDTILKMLYGQQG